MALTAPEQAAVARAVATTPSAYDGNAYETKFPSDLNDMGVMVPAVAREAGAAVAAGAQGAAGAATAIAKATEAGTFAAAAKASQESTSALAAALEVDPVKRTKVPATLEVRFEPGKTPDGLVVSRATTGTVTNARGLLETVAANALRHDFDPITGAYRGPLIEEARTNLLINSSAFNASGWGPYGVTITANAATAPDGTLTAYKIDATTNDSYFFQNVPVAAGTNYCCSIWLWTLSGTVDVDLVVSKPDGSTDAVTCRLTTVPSRFVLTDTVPAGVTSINFVIGTGTTFSNPESILAWGAQVEVGASPSSYIPTTAAAATRAADELTMAVGDWFNPVEGAFYVEGAIGVVGPNQTLLQLDDDTNANRYLLRRDADGYVRLFAFSSDGASVGIDGASPLPDNSVFRIAIRYKSGALALVINGATPRTSPAVYTLTGIKTLRIGKTIDPESLNGHIRRVFAFPRGLSNADLQAMTRIA